MTLSIHSPDELIAALPPLLGCAPEESIVFVPLRADLPLARVNLPTTASTRDEVWDAIRDAFRRHAQPGTSVAIVCVTNVVIPELGGLRLTEVTTGRLDAFLLRLRSVSASRQRKTKVVLGAMFALAVRHDALFINPEQQTSRIHRDRREVRSLTIEDLQRVRAALKKWATKARPGPRASSDMADIVDVMLGSGTRIGEVLALRWADIDLAATPHTLTIKGTIKTERGKGTYRKAHPKTEASMRTTALPSFTAAVLRRRQAEASASEIDAVFPTRNDTWLQVSNVQRRWREIRANTGLDWVTPHTFRKTVATLIAEELDPEVAAQQLGHTSSDITRRFYISRPAVAVNASDLLEQLADPSTPPQIGD